MEEAVQQPEEKRFTQSELNEILTRRLRREKRKRYELKNYIAYLEGRIYELKQNGGKTDE